jgi:hypothetical protein
MTSFKDYWATASASPSLRALERVWPGAIARFEATAEAPVKETTT